MLMRLPHWTGLLLAGALASGPVSALEPDYRGMLLGGVLPDSDRQAETGWGAQVLWGMPLSSWTALEPNFSGYTQTRDAGGDTRALGLGLDINFSNPRRVNRPFALMGFGALHEDGPNGDTAGAYANLGLGFIGRLGGSLSWRAEARITRVLNDELVNGRESVDDGRVMLGLQQSFGRVPPPVVKPQAPPPKPKPAPQPTLSTEAAPPPQAPAAAIAVPPPDSDGDGVIDEFDQCPSSAPGFQVDAAGCVIQQTLVLREIQFATGSNELSPEAHARLNELAAAMAAQPQLVLEVGGHTDAVGAAESNRRLSLRRAEIVRQALIAKGVAGARLQAVGYGERYPVASNETVSGRATNRRVEFKVLKR